MLYIFDQRVYFFKRALLFLWVMTNVRAYLVSTLAGTGAAGTVIDGLGTNARIGMASDVAFAMDQSYFIFADKDNHVIRKYDMGTEMVSTVAGSGVAGSTIAVGTAARFNKPNGIVIDSTNAFAIITDRDNNRIRKMDLATYSVTTLAGSAQGAVDSTGTSATFNKPWGIVMAPDQTHVMICDQNNHKIRKLVLATNDVTTIAGGSTLGHVNAVGTSALFNQPGNIALSTGGSFMIVADSKNNNIRHIAFPSATVTAYCGIGTVAAFADGACTSASFSNPQGVAIAPDNSYVLISDTDNHYIRKIIDATRTVSTYAGTGSMGGFADGPLLSAAFNNPQSITISANGQFAIVSDKVNAALRKVLLYFPPTPTVSPTTQPTFTPSSAPTVLPTRAPTLLPTTHPTSAPTFAPTFAPTAKPTCSPTSTPTVSPTAAPTAQPTCIPTSVPTLVPTAQPTCAPTIVPTTQPTFTPSSAPTVLPTRAPTLLPTTHPTIAPTFAPTANPTCIPTSTPTVSPTAAPTAQPTCIPTSVPTFVPTAQPTCAPTLVPTTQPTCIPTSTPTVSPTAAPTSQPTCVPTCVPTIVPTAQPTCIPTSTPTVSPTFAPTKVPTVHPTHVPTVAPTYSQSPTHFPTLLPSFSPSTMPSSVPSGVPTSLPSSFPTSVPTGVPTALPSAMPSSIPTNIPSAIPTSTPTSLPTTLPTALPSGIPTSIPTSTPTFSPTGIPSSAPSSRPTGVPTSAPSGAPSSIPSAFPSTLPTSTPSSVPSSSPTSVPTSVPTVQPSGVPTAVPSLIPTSVPTALPSFSPTCMPSSFPTSVPTVMPSSVPSSAPSSLPSFVPTSMPSFVPSSVPTAVPTSMPSGEPTSTPTSIPSGIPTSVPSNFPSSLPTSIPSAVPSSYPTSDPSSTPTAIPSAAPSCRPTSMPTSLPSSVPTSSPTSVPSSTPSSAPSVAPSSAPTSRPSSIPSNIPSSTPTTLPTSMPSSIPTGVPSSLPTSIPSSFPTCFPSSLPSSLPSSVPTSAPTVIPTSIPSSLPSSIPTCVPSSAPSCLPTSVPSGIPTSLPTAVPSSVPTSIPTAVPSALPSSIPSALPTSIPTAVPSSVPTSRPSSLPTALPTSFPSALPTSIPTAVPSSVPTFCPTNVPTSIPSSVPSALPSSVPTSIPSSIPTSLPSAIPSSVPTSCPSAIPTSLPSSLPTSIPTSLPSSIPTSRPSALPTSIPTSMPSVPPTSCPSSMPSSMPTNFPTGASTFGGIALDQANNFGFGVYGLPKIGLGHTIISAGDVNDDGIDDFIIGAPFSNNQVGAAYVIYGRAGGSPDVYLSSFNHKQGFASYGEMSGGAFGYAVCGVGDMNGDGVGDIAISAPYANNGLGVVYVIFGVTGYRNNIYMTEFISPGQGFKISGVAMSGNTGYALSGVGDVNGDGVPDILLSAPYTAEARGRVYVIYGRADRSYRDINLGNTTTAECTVILGSAVKSRSGFTLANVGDVNGDGKPDFAIGEPQALTNARGVVRIIFGCSNNCYAALDLNNLGSRGFSVFGPSDYAKIGTTISAAGNINGDGYADFIIGSFITNDFKGAAYIIYGKNTPSNIDLAVLDKSRGLKILGSGNGYFGMSVAGVMDINHDAVTDIVIGNPTSTNQVRAFAVMGSASLLFAGNVDVTTLSTRDQFTLTTNQANDEAGKLVSNVGDFNGDGFVDFAISAPGSNNGDGAVYVVYDVSALSASPTLTHSPVFNPTQGPSFKPSALPTLCPTLRPTSTPTVPTLVPTRSPTKAPSVTNEPTSAPSRYPTVAPSTVPSVRPTKIPTIRPTLIPTQFPTELPSAVPSSSHPSTSPTDQPSYAPNQSHRPTAPSPKPSCRPSKTPTMYPTKHPSVAPTLFPVISPTLMPTSIPTNRPTPNPSHYPTKRPTVDPTPRPTMAPTSIPTTGDKYATIVIDHCSEFKGSMQNNKFIVDVPADCELSISGGGGDNIFAIMPSPSSTITVSDFKLVLDKIDLRDIPSIRSFKDINMTRGSVLIHLPESQTIVLLGRDPAEMTVKQFMIRRRSDAQLVIGAMEVFFLVVTCLLTIFLGHRLKFFIEEFDWRSAYCWSMQCTRKVDVLLSLDGIVPTENKEICVLAEEDLSINTCIADMFSEEKDAESNTDRHLCALPKSEMIISHEDMQDVGDQCYLIRDIENAVTETISEDMKADEIDELLSVGASQRDRSDSELEESDNYGFQSISSSSGSSALDNMCLAPDSDTNSNISDISDIYGSMSTDSD